MQFPPFGIIYIALSLFFCLKREWFIYWFVIGSSLFYTTIIVIAGHTSFKPFHLNVILMFLFFVKGKIFRGKNYQGADSVFLLLFLVWIIISYIMSFALPGGFMVIASSNGYKGGKAISPFIADINNLTQLAFPAFGIFAFFVIRTFIKSSDDIRTFTKAFLWSFVPLAITVVILFAFRNVTHNNTLLQFFFKFINTLYDRDVSDNAYNSIGDIARTFTYVGEASYTAKYYLLLMSFFITMLLYKKNTKVRMYLLLGLILFQFGLIIILGSTTGYVGFCLLICIAAFFYFRYKYLFKRRTIHTNTNFLFLTFGVFFLIALPITVIFYDQIIFFLNYLQDSHIDKLEAAAGSGENRFMSMVIGLDVFLQSPLFGVGYGNNRSTSYMIFLLSDTGIIGLALLNMFCFYLVVVPLRKLKKMPNQIKVHGMAYVTIFLNAWIIYFCFASNVAIMFGWFWIIAAILSKLCRYDSDLKKDKTNQNENDKTVINDYAHLGIEQVWN